MELILPSTEYEQTFREAFLEFRAETGKGNIEQSLVTRLEESKDFAEFVRKLQEEVLGKHLPEGYVPHTIYWLVDGGKFIGWLDIRHRLTEHLREFGGHIGYAIRPSERKKGYGEQILKLGLIEAKKLGISSVRIMCDEDNIGSRRIIEKNGGVFDDTVTMKEGGVRRRYWIHT